MNPNEEKIEFNVSGGTNYLCGIYSFTMCCSIVAIPCLPCVGICAGQTMKNQECTVDDKRIHYKSGWLNKEDKYIPLDRVQDLNIRRGWLARIIGVASIDIQTAGAGGAEGRAEATLIAPTDPDAVRDLIVRKRDQLVLGIHPAVKGGGIDSVSQPTSNPIMATDINEIKSTLLRMEQLMQDKSSK
ncbi:bacterial PH domain-containing protein [Globomyces pollinis-pini]|nr:bacterial PH domain-containing protein [Globomyces pollinis-pini]KAJ2993125.1 hypothetical protein HDV02_002635 [Globomyces sp. JEL0801]